ncbi:MAG: hypothetical protein KY476_12135, partial [Planctomycetes bacterium]|nr:hypothetical protein [Planctomycetota bacterium]
MGDVLGGLLLLMLGLFALAAIGHGLWLVGKEALRTLTGRRDGTPHRRRPRCPRCAAELGYGWAQCPSCGFPIGDPPRFTLDGDLAGTERQIRRLARAGVIGTELERRLARLVEDERERPTTVEFPAQPSTVPRERPLEVPRAARPAAQAESPAPGERQTAAELRDRDRPVAAPVRDVPLSTTGPTTTKTQAAPREERRPIRAILHAFMEEKNIRWGEITSAMLIVGSAVGLVISLWSTLREAIPYFPALVFMLLTAAIHGAGLYTLKRWKLQATSRGLLMISTLLVPLNFVAAIALSDQRPVFDPLYVSAVTVGVVAYGAIVASSARIILLQGHWLMCLGVMGPAVGQLLIARVAKPGQSNLVLLLQALVPFAAWLTAVGGQLLVAARRRRLTRRRIADLFRLLALCSFALLTTLGLLVWKTRNVWDTLSALTPFLSLSAAGVLGVGVLIHQRALQPKLAEARTAGTWLALVGGSLMLTAVVLAWPQPALLIAAGLVNWGALSMLGFAARLPVLHFSAIGSAALAVLVAFHLIVGTISIERGTAGQELVRVVLMGRSSLLLSAAALAAIIAGLGLKRMGRTDDGTGYVWGAAGLAAMAVLVAAYAGFVSGVDGEWTTLVFALAAVAVLGLAGATRRPLASWGGSSLLLVALIHALAWNEPLRELLAQLSLAPRRRLLTAFLWHAALAAFLAVV